VSSQRVFVYRAHHCFQSLTKNVEMFISSSTNLPVYMLFRIWVNVFYKAVW
jgi:hypothetical protein